MTLQELIDAVDWTLAIQGFAVGAAVMLLVMGVWTCTR